MKRFSLILFSFLMLVLPGVGHAALGDYFVSTDWLNAHRDQVVIIDVRKSVNYKRDHVDGAHHVEREQYLQTRNHLKNLVPSSPAITKLLSSLGVSPESTLVVYAEDDNPFAARLVWTLRYHGVKKAFVLDGGYNQWEAENRAISQVPTASPKPSHFTLTADADYLEARADADYIYTRLENPGVVVWDARSPGEYAGTDVRTDRGGHIPGAVSLNWSNLLTKVNGVKVLKSREEIVVLLQAHGITTDKEIVTHCQTGVRSAYATLVMLGLGYPKVKNYDGSWLEWGNNHELPIINAQGQLESPISQ